MTTGDNIMQEFNFCVADHVEPYAIANWFFLYGDGPYKDLIAEFGLLDMVSLAESVDLDEPVDGASWLRQLRAKEEAAYDAIEAEYFRNLGNDIAYI